MQILIRKLLLKFVILVSIVLAILTTKTQAQVPNIIRDYFLEPRANYSLLIVKSDRLADYEIVQHNTNKIITIKIRNASLPKTIAKQKKFTDIFIFEADIQKIEGKDVWIQVFTKPSDVDYSVDRQMLLKGILALKIFNKQKPQFTPKDINALRSISLLPDFSKEKLIFSFNRSVNYKTTINKVPSLKIDLEFDNISRQFDSKQKQILSQYIDNITFSQKGSNLVATIDLNSVKLDYNLYTQEKQNQLILELEPASEFKGFTAEDQENFINAHAQQDDQENIQAYTFFTAEELFGAEKYPEAKITYTKVINNNPNTENALLAMFRLADIANIQQQQTPTFDGHFQVINLYQQAISQAVKLDFKTPKTAYGWLQIANNYKNAKFYEEALDYNNKILQQAPQSSYEQEAKYNIANINFLQSNYNDAIRLMQNFLLRFPRSKNTLDIYFQLGSSYYAIGEYDLAYNYFITARKIDDSGINLNPEILFAEANAYYQQHKYQKFISSGYQLIQNFPDHKLSTIMAVSLGDQLFDEGEYQQSIYYYDLAIEKGSNELQFIARIQKARLQAEIRAVPITNLIEELQQIAQSTDNTIIQQDALLQKILLYSSNNLDDQAAQSIAEFEQLFPDSNYIKNGAIQVLKQENLNKTITSSYLDNQYQDVISNFIANRKLVINSQDQLLLNLVANSYIKLNNYHDAIAIYQQLLKIGDQNHLPEINYNLGNSFYIQGLYDNAVKYLLEVVQKFPNSLYADYAKSYIAKIYREQNKFDEAIQQLQQVLNSNNLQDTQIIQRLIPKSWFDLAELQAQLGLFDQALESYQQVQDNYLQAIRDPAAPEYLRLSFFKLGDMYRELGLNDKALQQYSQAFNLFTNSQQVPWAKFYSAEILLDQQKYSEALQLLNDIIDDNSENANRYIQQLAAENKRSLLINRQYANFLRGDTVN